MEKFGIFELLDTLSAITASETEEQPPQPPQTEEIAPATATPTPDRSGASAQTKNEAAFAAFISRQEEISKRIDRNK